MYELEIKNDYVASEKSTFVCEPQGKSSIWLPCVSRWRHFHWVFISVKQPYFPEITFGTFQDQSTIFKPRWKLRGEIWWLNFPLAAAYETLKSQSSVCIIISINKHVGIITLMQIACLIGMWFCTAPDSKVQLQFACCKGRNGVLRWSLVEGQGLPRWKTESLYLIITVPLITFPESRPVPPFVPHLNKSEYHMGSLRRRGANVLAESEWQVKDGRANHRSLSATLAVCVTLFFFFLHCCDVVTPSI